MGVKSQRQHRELDEVLGTKNQPFDSLVVRAGELYKEHRELRVLLGTSPRLSPANVRRLLRDREECDKKRRLLLNEVCGVLGLPIHHRNDMLPHLKMLVAAHTAFREAATQDTSEGWRKALNKALGLDNRAWERLLMYIDRMTEDRLRLRLLLGLSASASSAEVRNTMDSIGKCNDRRLRMLYEVCDTLELPPEQVDNMLPHLKMLVAELTAFREAATQDIPRAHIHIKAFHNPQKRCWSAEGHTCSNLALLTETLRKAYSQAVVHVHVQPDPRSE